MISTSRLLLRPFSLADVPKLFTSIEDGMPRWIPDQLYRDEAHAEQLIGALMAYTAQPPEPRTRPYVLGIEHRDTGALVGHVGLSPARGSVEIGYAIEQCMQGNGLATEAVTAIARWALAELSLPEVLGIVEAENLPSRRVLETAGFLWGGEEIKKQADDRTRTLPVYRCASRPA